LPGTYLVDVCGLTGTLINCQRVTLIIVRAPHNGQIVYSHKVSIAAGGVQSFKVGVTNFATQNIYAQVTITGTGNLGDTFTVQTAIVLIAPGASANNLVATLTLTPAEIGETFTFSASVAVSATDPGALTGFSSLQAGTAHFTVSP